MVTEEAAGSSHLLQAITPPAPACQTQGEKRPAHQLKPGKPQQNRIHEHSQGSQTIFFSCSLN